MRMYAPTHGVILWRLYNCLVSFPGTIPSFSGSLGMRLTTTYAVVVYLVMMTQRDTHTQFIVAKTKVAPIQTCTIPRLELLFAMLFSRLITTVSAVLESTLPNLKLVCYTDSTVALYWIKGTNKEWRLFVQKHVNEICKETSLDWWYHCPGVTNPPFKRNDNIWVGGELFVVIRSGLVEG